MSNLDRFAGAAIADPQDKPLDFIAQCSGIRCREVVHFGDKCIQDEDGDYYCCSECYIRASGANEVYAGTEEFA